MECNKDEALRVKEIAERKFMLRDVFGARKFAMKARELFPALEGINQMIATLDVYLASEGKVSGEVNWYAVLCLNPSANDDTLKKQYKKLALQLHPDKNKSLGAEGAFKLISEAWSVLSDSSRRIIYDKKINDKGLQHRKSQARDYAVPNTNSGFYPFSMNEMSRVRAPKNDSNAAHSSANPSPHLEKSKTFWTCCHRCKMQYEYLRLYLNKKLLCPNCHEPFLASETMLAPNGPGFTSSTSQQFHQNASQNTKGAYVFGGNYSHFSGRKTTVFQHGINLKPRNSNFQWGAFSSTAGAASAAASSVAAAQAANVVHQTYEKVRRERQEAEAAAKKAGAFNRKNSSLKRNISASIIHYFASDDNLPTKTNEHGRMFTGHSGTSGKEGGAHRLSVGLSKWKMSTTENKFSRPFTHLDIHSTLIEKSKSAICGKMEEWHSCAASNTEGKNNTNKRRKIREDDEQMMRDVFHDDSTDQVKLDESRKGTKNCTPVKNSLNANTNKSNDVNANTNKSDDVINEPDSMEVLDPDFHDFDNDRSEESFESDQVWATYDEEDGMPRYYALIQKVISFKPFKLLMRYLTSKSNLEFGTLNWITSGFAKTCGDFRVGRYEVNETINIFSHKVRWEKGPRGVIRIVPKKGEIWALYRNWSPQWNEHTPNDTIYKYDIVEVLADYSEELGVTVARLVKVAGFRTIFSHQLDSKEVTKIKNEEMLCFSHQVPSYILTGEEAENAPKGCHELDPAATPLELLQVIGERKTDAVMENCR